MEVLILSCGTGGGHNEAGNAVREELERRGHRVTMMNPYELRNHKTADTINQMYIRTAQKAPHFFGLLYSMGNLYRRLPVHSPVYYMNGKMSAYLQEYLEKYPVDLIIMPHIFPAQILLNMKKRRIKIPKTMLIATDYTCIPFTEESDCDVYIIPSVDLKEEFIRRGIPSERIYPYGIPVRKAFREQKSKENAMQNLGLDSDKQYILVSGGSIGAGKVEWLVALLYHWCKKKEHMNIIVVCGHNTTLYQRLKKRYKKKVQVIGYTEKMAEYMKASRVFITKPGGLSITEGAVMGTPMVHVASIPGCESRNLKFFKRHEMSIPVRSTRRAVWNALKYLQDKEHCQKMMRAQQKAINANATEEIVDLAENIVKY